MADTDCRHKRIPGQTPSAEFQAEMLSPDLTGYHNASRLPDSLTRCKNTPALEALEEIYVRCEESKAFVLLRAEGTEEALQ